MNMRAWLTPYTVALQTGATSRGDPSFASNTTVLARMEPATQIVVSASGDQQMATTRMTSETFLPVGTRVYMPGDTNPKRVLASTGAANKAGTYTLYESWL